MKVLIPEYISQPGIDYLREKGYELVITDSYQKDALLKNIPECDAAIVRVAVYDKEVIDAAPRLKVLAKHGMGVDSIDVDYCTEKGIQVTFTPSTNSESVAEHAFYLMFACARGTNIMYKQFREGFNYAARNQYPSVELYQKTVGILGMGRIGQALARKCRGADMKVIGFDPFMTQEQVGDEVHMVEDLDVLLKEADFISFNLPLSKDTMNLVDEEKLALVKKTAFIIDTARGGILNEKALIAALQEDRIAGAGIDVFDPEPPTRDNPLFQMDNVIVTPHSAGCTKEALDRMSLNSAISVDEVLTGKAISWPVNRF